MKLVALIAAGFLSGMGISAQAGSYAASPLTRAFIANVTPNIDFLTRSSRLAETKSAAASMRAYAGAEAFAQADVAADLAIARVPYVAATGDAGGLMSGRSVATDAAPEKAGPAANDRAALTPADLEQLSALSGRAFDDGYWTRQLDALSQLRADYVAYIARGDDASLVAMAKRELPRVERQLLALSKV
jgi:hypothetical protein